MGNDNDFPRLAQKPQLFQMKKEKIFFLLETLRFQGDYAVCAR